VEKETRNLVIMAVAVLAVFGAAYACIAVYAGTSSPFYTVESGSMMHSNNSKVGIIDTGDMVIVKNPDNAEIVTYVEGSKTGYARFGDYGDVILYSRAGQTAVIHRAILYVGHNSNGTWDISSLAGYGGEWYINGTDGGTLSADDLKEVNGVLSFRNFGYRALPEITVNLDGLTPKVSGYITMGDNNRDPDQSNGISGAAVSPDRITGVAGKEVPWLGCIKLLFTGTNTDNIPGNSLMLLAASFILIIASVLAVGLFFEKRAEKKKKEDGE